MCPEAQALGRGRGEGKPMNMFNPTYFCLTCLGFCGRGSRFHTQAGLMMAGPLAGCDM